MTIPAWHLNCPIPVDEFGDRIQLAHGEGARLTRRLIEEQILPRFHSDATPALADAVHLMPAAARIALTTDSYVVSPLFFPGGDIGALAVHGTVNDLAVSGAIPRWLTLSMILEEGLPLAVLKCILESAARAADACGVEIVAGDTKVVPRGAADGLFLNTAGVGEVVDPAPPGPEAIEPGDVLLVSGPIGRHGIAVLCAREELAFEPLPCSDSAPLTEVVHVLRASAGSALRAVRDATRGGVAAVLHEWSAASGLSFHLVESQLPVSPDVRGACEVLGLDPLHVACEGTLVAAIASEPAQAVLQALSAHCPQAALIGSAGSKSLCPVMIQRSLGREQPVDEPAGAQLPRIC